MRTPLIVPEPLVFVFIQVPEAAPADKLSAVSVQFTRPAQPGRATLPVTAVCAFGLVFICPSMQSTSPSSTPGPVAELVPWLIVTLHVPLTLPSCGSEPCQAPAQTPERSGGVCGGGLPPPPPPHPSRSEKTAARQKALSGPEPVSLAERSYPIACLPCPVVPW